MRTSADVGQKESQHGRAFYIAAGVVALYILPNLFIISWVNSKIQVLGDSILLIYLYFLGATSTHISVFGNI